MKHLIFSVVILTSFFGWCESPEQKSVTFNTGLEHFQKNDPNKAKQVFIKQLQKDKNHIPSLFNLSVIAARQSQKGEALAYLRHLKALDARIDGLTELSAYVEKTFSTSIFPSRPGYLGFLESIVIRNTSLPLWLGLTWVILIIFIFQSVRFLKERQQLLAAEEPLKKPGPIFFIGGVFLIVSLIFTTWKASDSTTVRGTLKVGQQDVKAGPSETEVQIFRLNEAEEVTYKQSLNGWHQIVTLDGKSGWVPPQAPLHFY